MKRVCVVFTEHEENGLANVSALLAILEHITPEAIFLECPRAAFDDHLNGTRRNLESTAVSRYRANHPVDLIPVDLPTPEADFFTNFHDLIERIARTGPEYDQLARWHRQRVNALGFAYLNSDTCSDLFAKRHEVILASIATLADHKLAGHYESWIETNELRDKAMMKNIEDYCRQASFSSAVFLVGAAHRQSVIHLSRSEPGVGPSPIQWDFAGFLDERNLTVARHNEEL